MATVKTAYGTTTTYTITGSGTLASANYATGNPYNDNTNLPLDIHVEAAIAVGTVAGNKQIILFIIGSNDNTNYDTQNSSVTDTTHDAMMPVLGVMPAPNNTETVRRRFSVANAFGGVPPPYWKVVVKNDSGAAFTSAAFTTTEITATVV